MAPWRQSRDTKVLPVFLQSTARSTAQQHPLKIRTLIDCAEVLMGSHVDEAEETIILHLPSALSLSHGYTTAQWAHPSGCFTSTSNSYKLSKIEPTVFSLSSQHDFFWVPFLTKRQHKPLNSLSQKAGSHLRHLSHCFHSKLFPSSAFCFLQVSPLGPIFSLLTVVPWGWFPPPHCLTLNLLCLPLHHHTPACPLL